LEPTARQSGHGEFIRLWTAASHRVHTYLLTMVLSWADAEDLLQEVGVTAWEKFDEYDRQRDFAAWACGIARNKVLSFNQLVWHRLVQSSDLLDRIAQEIEVESQVLEQQNEALFFCLQRLNEGDRRILQARYTPGMSLKKIAQEAGRPLQGLYKSLQRIHAQVFDCVTRRMAMGRDR